MTDEERIKIELRDEIEEMRKMKSRGRVATMLAKRADRDAAKRGKRWNAMRARWED